MSEEIPVLFTPDENFMLQTSVAILSMEKNKNKETKYHYYFLLSSSIDNKCFKYIEYLNQIIPNLTYTITYFDTSQIDKEKIYTPHITSSTYYRLFAAQFYDFDKCIYNDGDIIVLGDLTGMYDINLDGKYVAGAKTIIQHQGDEKDVERIEKWGFPSMDQYVIAGNLVFNIRKIKEDNMISSFAGAIKKSFPQQDQDVLNYCCYNHIAFLELKYAMLNRWIFNEDIYRFKNQIYDREEIIEAMTNPAIIHFAGGCVKPWINVRTAYAKEWWQYAKQLLPIEEYDYWRARAEKITEGKDWTSILSSIKKMNRRIYIFGCTWIGQLLLGWLKNGGVQVDGCVDNSRVVQGVEVEGKMVYDLYDIELTDNIAFVISSQKAYPEIYDQLIDYGVSEDEIYIYRHEKDDLYLQSLDPNYYDFEYKDLMAKEIGMDAYNTSIDNLRKLDTKENWKRIWR